MDKVCVIFRSALLSTCILVAAASDVSASASTGGAWAAGGDLRAGYFASERRSRDGGESSDDDFRARLRGFLQREIAPGWLFRTRLAGQFSSGGNDAAFRLERYRATSTGTVPGEIHFDEFYLGWIDPSGRHQLRTGRIQTAFGLPVVPGKSLDRNDSSSVGIGWTDGFHLQSLISERWRGHLIGQVNHRNGAGNTVRAPMSFADSSSRLGWYLALQALEHPGPFTMRMLSVNWVPNALATHGPADPRREDYLTIAAKTAAEWPVGKGGTRLVLAGELGHAVNRPERGVLMIDGDGDVGGGAYQFSVNLFDIWPGHHLGAVYGRAQGGWLTSNDYRNNDELFEVRYQRELATGLSMELRFRIREELERRTGAERRQRDHDVYARLTWRFALP